MNNHNKLAIYSLVNTINGKRYIGRATHVYKRKSQHIQALIKGIHKNEYLQRSWNKYGQSNFKFEILEELDSTGLLNEREVYWINYYDSMNHGYNLESGGRQLKKLSEGTKKKMSINNPRVWKGKKYGEHNVSKKTYQYDLDGNFIKQWGSITEICDVLGFNKDSISYCCTGKKDYYKKFRWYHEFKGNKIDIYFKFYGSERKVRMLALDGRELKVFESARNAQRFLGKARNKIYAVATGKRNTWAGYKWEYV